MGVREEVDGDDGRGDGGDSTQFNPTLCASFLSRTRDIMTMFYSQSYSGYNVILHTRHELYDWNYIDAHPLRSTAVELTECHLKSIEI